MIRIRMNLTIRACWVAAAMLALAACGGEKHAEDRQASEQKDALRRQQVLAMETQLRRQEQMVEEARRDQEARFDQIQIQGRQLAAELEELKRTMGMTPSPEVAAAPEVQDETPGQAQATPATAPAPGESRSLGIFMRLIVVIVLLAVIFVLFQLFMNRWQMEEDEEVAGLDPMEDQKVQTAEGMISISPQAQEEMRRDVEDKDPDAKA